MKRTEGVPQTQKKENYLKKLAKGQCQSENFAQVPHDLLGILFIQTNK